MGSASDTTIGRDTIERLPRLPWEWWIGDRVYMYVQRVLAGYRRRRIPGSQPPRYYELSEAQVDCNGIISFYRARVEQVCIYMLLSDSQALFCYIFVSQPTLRVYMPLVR